MRSRILSTWVGFTILAAASSIAVAEEQTRDLIIQPNVQEANTGRFMLGVGGSFPSTGNPFLKSSRPRPTLLPPMPTSSGPMTPFPAAPSPAMSPRVDSAVTPASFDQPTANLGASAPLSPVNIPATSATPATTPQQPEAAPVAAPLALSGLALLTQRPTQGGNIEHPLAPVIRWADDALQQMQGLRDYSATFSKREWVDGRLQDQQVLYAKVRHHPYSVYLQFLAPNDVRGQEAIYVVGRNGGNLLAHPVGIKQALVGTISIAPDSSQAMEGNRHPITDFGVRRLLERYREGAVQDANYGECEVQIMDNKVKVNDRPCVCIEVVHPQPRKEFRFHRCRIFIDQAWNVPVRYECYNWPTRQGEQPQLVEEYTYQGLKLNAGLSDADFDPNNPQYRFN